MDATDEEANDALTGQQSACRGRMGEHVPSAVAGGRH